MHVTSQQAMGYLVASLPYILAVLALIQAIAATSASRAARKQAEAALEQVDLLRTQISLAEEVALMELQPRFAMRALGVAELGTVKRLPDDSQVFHPMDAHGRDHPDQWQRRRPFSLECTTTVSPLLVTISALPVTVTCLTTAAGPVTNGSVISGEILIPANLPEQAVELVVSSHMASNPGRQWTQHLQILHDRPGA